MHHPTASGGDGITSASGSALLLGGRQQEEGEPCGMQASGGWRAGNVSLSKYGPRVCDCRDSNLA